MLARRGPQQPIQLGSVNPRTLLPPPPQTPLHAQYDWTTGVLDNWKWNGGKSESHLARTPCVPLFCTLLNRGGKRRVFFDYQGRAGDHFHCTLERSPGHIQCRPPRREGFPQPCWPSGLQGLASSHAGILPVPLKVKNCFKFLFSKGFKGAFACVVLCGIPTEDHSRAHAGASASCQPHAIPPKKDNRPNDPQEQAQRDYLDDCLHSLRLSLRLLSKSKCCPTEHFRWLLWEQFWRPRPMEDAFWPVRGPRKGAAKVKQLAFAPPHFGNSVMSNENRGFAYGRP